MKHSELSPISFSYGRVTSRVLLINFKNKSIYDASGEASRRLKKYDKRLDKAMLSQYSVLPAILKEFCQQPKNDKYLDTVKAVALEEGVHLHDRQHMGFADLCFFVEKVSSSSECHTQLFGTGACFISI